MVQQLDPKDAHHLKAYVERFLQASYNMLMTGLQKDLDPGLNISRLSQESFLRFFKLASFFTRHVRLQQVRPLQHDVPLRNALPACDIPCEASPSCSADEYMCHPKACIR